MTTDFRHTVARLEQRIDELGGAVIRDHEEIAGWKSWKGELDGGEARSLDDSAWDDLGSWNEAPVPSWHRAKVTVPERFDDEPVSVSFRVGGYLYALFNAEALAYVDGELLQGLDAYHHDLLLSERAEGGREYVIAIFLFWKPDFGKTDWSPNRTAAFPDLDTVTQIQHIDRTAESFYWDSLTAYEVALSLGANSPTGRRILGALDRAFTDVDFRGPLGEAFYESAASAGRRLRDELYDKARSDAVPTALAVGQTHIDLAWFWPIDVNRLKIGRTFATILGLMDTYPDFTFMQNQAKVYEYCKQDFPELYEAVERRVAEGRWEVNGGMWTEPDCNMPSGESLVRQLVYGLRYFRREFGDAGEVLVVMDAFGYTWALPQLMRRCGLKYFLTNKMSWNQFNRMPYDSFQWQGLDGSRVLAHQLTAQSRSRPGWTTTSNAVLDADMLMGSWAEYRQKDQTDRVLFTYGYGDGGGGPTSQMLERARRIREIGAPVRLEHGTVQGYFEDLEKRLDSERTPIWNDELYLELHRGTYTSKAAIKRGNRKGEVALHDAEPYCAMASAVAGHAYPREQLYEAWDLLLVNQQHDILPGSVTRQPELDAIRDHRRVREVASGLARDALSAISENVETAGESLVVFNPVSWRRSGAAKASVADLPDEFRLVDTADRDVPYQVLSRDSDTSELLMQMDGVPSCGYTSVSIEAGAPAKHESSLAISERALENRFFRVELDEQGSIVSLYDKKTDRQVLAPGSRANAFQLFEDKPLNYDAWDIDQYYQDKMWEVGGVTSVRVLEEGPVRGTVEVRRSFGRSSMVQRIHLYDSTPRIDFDTEVEWDEKHTLLKVAFPVQVNSTDATYEIQFGAIERPTHWSTSWDQARFEVSAQKWADLSEGDYGVSLLNDCKYDYDIKGNVMRLSLLRSPTQPDPHTDEGHHEFIYSLYPHTGDWRNGAVRAGYELNYPMTVVKSGRHGDGLPPELSLVSSNREGVFIDTVKLADESDRLVLRCYEGHNTRGPVELRIGGAVASALEVDLLEEEAGPVQYEDDTVTFEIAPYQVRTFSVELR